MAPPRRHPCCGAGRVDLAPARNAAFWNDAGGSSELSCQWDYVAQADATAGYDRLLARTRGCLGADAMPSGQVFQNTSGWRPVEANVHMIEREGVAETQIKLELVEYIAPVPTGPPRHRRAISSRSASAATRNKDQAASRAGVRASRSPL